MQTTDEIAQLHNVPLDFVKVIPQAPGYVIFKDGRVWTRQRTYTCSRRSGKEYLATAIGRFRLWQVVSQTKYHGVRVGCLDGKWRTMYVHRLVAEAWIPNPLNKEEVNHIDSDKKNNNLDNLEWVTSQENTNHYIQNNGGRAPNCKLSFETAAEIRKAFVDAPKKWGMVKKLARLYKVAPSTIRSVLNRSRWIDR